MWVPFACKVRLPKSKKATQKRTYPRLKSGAVCPIASACFSTGKWEIVVGKGVLSPGSQSQGQATSLPVRPCARLLTGDLPARSGVASGLVWAACLWQENVGAPRCGPFHPGGARERPRRNGHKPTGPPFRGEGETLLSPSPSTLTSLAANSLNIALCKFEFRCGSSQRKFGRFIILKPC